MWQPAAYRKDFPDSEIHVWRLSLELKPKSLGVDPRSLSADEKRRAEGFRFQRDMHSYILCHGFLRLLLGQYLGAAPGELKFGAGKYGKPFLVEPRENGGIQFSLSHSGDLGLFAFSRGRRVGVDIERIRNFPGMSDVSQRFFSSREHDALSEMPEGSRAAAFHACWTRKEAVVKALGASIAHLCEAIVVSTLPSGPAELFRIPAEEGEASSWRLLDLPAGPGYTGALCFEAPLTVSGDIRRGQVDVKLWEPAGRP